VEDVVGHFGCLNVVANCAGGSDPKDQSVHDFDLDVWQRTMNLNLLHPFLCSRYAIPHLRLAGGGSIINFSSNKGLVGASRPIYSAAKGGIVALTRTMAALYARDGIRVNAIAPGGVLTERTRAGHMRESSNVATSRAKRLKNYPFSSGIPEDMTGVAVFLASDESRMFTGTTLAADGGVSSYLAL
jgi:NAD(P)-dependent dehydrogenase (short-subunit alcohol dehydrogenase family)